MAQITGKIAVWKDDKGYGFIAGDGDGKQYFVHISAFGTIPRRPEVGDRIEFAIATAGDGKQQAIRAQIAGLSRRATGALPTQRERAPMRTLSRTRGRRRSSFGAGLALPLAIAVGVYAYSQFQSGGISLPDVAPVRTLSQPVAAPRFQCSGKIHCSEMTSCEEARFYQSNCPGTKMDGDGDGNPCESQWCGG